jgi:NAD(P)-dependent dehydrogenase (short-subunit alcohol dehydrogenase family)
MNRQNTEEFCFQLKLIGSTYPLKRSGQPEEIASAVAFLANNDEAGWITGQLLAVDGGSTLTDGASAVIEQGMQLIMQNK